MSVSPRSPEALLRRLEWTVLRRLDGQLQGDYRTLFRGFGLDLADLREYQYHDDVRHIDWNVTARLQTPYVREYREDREVTAWLLVDVSGSVEFGSRAATKRDVAAGFAALVAAVLARRGNRIGALLYDETLERVIEPRTGRQQVLRILRELGARPARRARATTDLRAFLEAALRLVPRRSLVFVISDFISRPDWAAALAQLGQRHDVLAVRLHDPLERELPDLGLVVMQDAETGEQLFVDTHDQRFRQRFAAAAELRERTLRHAFATAGVDVLELSTEDDLADAVMRYADLRKRRSNLPARRAVRTPASAP